MLSFPLASRRAIGWDVRINDIDAGEPMNLKVHSGGTTLVICVKSAGRWGRVVSPQGRRVLWDRSGRVVEDIL
jgi:hypothetical protein